jgi:hypothetical protein
MSTFNSTGIASGTLIGFEAAASFVINKQFGCSAVGSSERSVAKLGEKSLGGGTYCRTD